MNLPLVILLPHLIQHVVFAIAGTFLYHVDHFRQYSTFCASLHKLKDILGELQHRYIVVDSRVEGHCLLHYYLATYQCKFFIFFFCKDHYGTYHDNFNLNCLTFHDGCNCDYTLFFCDVFSSARQHTTAQLP